ncbi:MAG TPA: FHA domain-containing protein [Myxococcota bacterium]|nr:FHA domain-containing protein [Myxococcota bacterium]
MAHLRDRSGKIFPVESTHLIGRARSMQTVLANPEVSTQHLSITWTGTEWVLRDLASRNGSWVNGRKLTPGEQVSLRAGAALGVGSAVEQLTLVDDRPPFAFAASGSDIVEGEAAFLALPSADDPLVLVELDGEQGWVRVSGEERSPVESGMQVEVAGSPWTLSLPDVVARTIDAGSGSSGGVGLRFRVSGNEEYVEITVTLRGATHRLTPRTYHDILLNLARTRLDDAELPPGEQGWVYTTDLMKMSAISSNQLYVGLHRIRKEFEAIDTVLGATLIERRSTSHQVRLAVGDLGVESV